MYIEFLKRLISQIKLIKNQIKIYKKSTINKKSDFGLNFIKIGQAYLFKT